MSPEFSELNPTSLVSFEVAKISPIDCDRIHFFAKFREPHFLTLQKFQEIEYDHKKLVKLKKSN